MKPTTNGISLVLTDLDGTVAQLGKHIVSDTVRQAVIDCDNRGIHMVPVTGRSHQMARAVLSILGFDDLGVFDNGATIQNCRTGEIVWRQWMTMEQVKLVAGILAPLSRIIDYSQESDEHEPNGNEMARIGNIGEPVSSVYAVVRQADVEVVNQQLAAVPDITFYWAASTNAAWTDCRGVHVTNVLADKFHGVNALRGITGVPKEQTLAIGDGKNDLALFNNADYRVAMGNATSGLKAAADHIVGTIDEDGFAEAMRLLVL